ncbi:AAA family ATPase [Ideonella alba]|uniref:ATP-binding protein n=1 Tax=Ideonella alba TaxID=2824118 RepID=A0A941BBC3_9BURK|nr:ATP-binding protein [Ideonella alba]MBQ0930720.1 ATP-binding protein [Ideonella alba]
MRWPEPPRGAVLLAIVGAESTGKSTLAAALAQRLVDDTGLACTHVAEVLREWCDREGRTPRQHEQDGIAAEQARRLAEACSNHAVVVADTTPLMTAVYHHQVFGDDTLDAPAQAWQTHCALTLLTALDLPWQADGLQRDGPQVRAPVDARLRRLLVGAGLPFAVVRGSGRERLESAVDAVAPLLRARRTPGRGLFSRLDERDAGPAGRAWRCEHCDDPACEHALRQLAPR